MMKEYKNIFKMNFDDNRIRFDIIESKVRSDLFVNIGFNGVMGMIMNEDLDEGYLFEEDDFLEELCKVVKGIYFDVKMKDIRKIVRRVVDSCFFGIKDNEDIMMVEDKNNIKNNFNKISLEINYEYENKKVILIDKKNLKDNIYFYVFVDDSVDMVNLVVKIGDSYEVYNCEMGEDDYVEMIIEMIINNNDILKDRKIIFDLIEEVFKDI